MNMWIKFVRDLHHLQYLDCVQYGGGGGGGGGGGLGGEEGREEGWEGGWKGEAWEQGYM